MPTNEDYFAAAATIAAALIARKPGSTEPTPADAAKLVWEVKQALHEAAPKGKATVHKSPF